MSKPNARKVALQRYSFLTGYPARNDEEEKELHDLYKMFCGAEDDPGWWPPATRWPRFKFRPKDP